MGRISALWSAGLRMRSAVVLGCIAGLAIVAACCFVSFSSGDASELLEKLAQMPQLVPAGGGGGSGSGVCKGPDCKQPAGTTVQYEGMNIKAVHQYDPCKDTKLMHLNVGYRTFVGPYWGSRKHKEHGLDGGVLPNVQRAHFQSTSELCCGACKENPKCKLWEYDTTQRLCSLKASAKGWGGAMVQSVRIPNLVSGFLEGFVPIAIPGYGISTRKGNLVWTSRRGIPGHRQHYRPNLETCEWICSMIGDACGCVTKFKNHCVITKTCQLTRKAGRHYSGHSMGVWARTGMHPTKPLNGTLKATGVMGKGAAGEGHKHIEDCGPLGHHCGEHEWFA